MCLGNPLNDFLHKLHQCVVRKCFLWVSFDCSLSAIFFVSIDTPKSTFVCSCTVASRKSTSTCISTVAQQNAHPLGYRQSHQQNAHPLGYPQLHQQNLLLQVQLIAPENPHTNIPINNLLQPRNNFHSVRSFKRVSTCQHSQQICNS